MMFAIPSTEKGIDDNKASLEAVMQMNERLMSLINKYPSVRFGPWVGSHTKRINWLQDFQRMSILWNNIFLILID